MKFKVSFNPCLADARPKYFIKTFETIEEAKTCIDLIADYTLFLHKCRLDYSNMALIEFLNDEGIWEDWYDQ